MELFNEFSLAIAVALPVLVVAVLNVFLAWGGERGTLLLPSLAPYPSIEIAKRAEAKPAVQAVEIASQRDAVIAEPANDALEREAA